MTEVNTMVLRLPQPKPKSYNVQEMATAPWSVRLKSATLCWAENGYGTPISVLFFYIAKMMCFVGMWLYFISLNETTTSVWSLEDWFTKSALYKAIVWSLVFELLGLGCGSGPLTGRYLPPFAAALYFLRKGSVRLPPFGRTKLYRRTWFDLFLYVTQVGMCFSALCSAQVSSMLTLAICLNLALMGLRDRTAYLAARPEHYLIMLCCMLSANHWFFGIVVVQTSLWLWAAVSKCTPHFPYVITVMCSNAPYGFLKPLRRRMYRNFPHDLRPSPLARLIAHSGTVLEFGFPLLLLFSADGPWLVLGLALMVYFHVFIISQFPMGVPLEWNLMMIYGGFFCFGGMSGQSLVLPDLGLGLFLLLNAAAIPLIGNLRPRDISFLPSMRYYAGNWAYSVWLIRPHILARMKAEMDLPIDHPGGQLTRLYDETTAKGALDAVTAFRHMHLHGRLLHELVPKSVRDMSAYEYLDGEILAGWILGWNFGDGHLHDHRLLGAIQDVMNLDEGDIRTICVESQPLHHRALSWRILDARSGVVSTGVAPVNELLQHQPWPSQH